MSPGEIDAQVVRRQLLALDEALTILRSSRLHFAGERDEEIVAALPVPGLRRMERREKLLA